MGLVPKSADNDILQFQCDNPAHLNTVDRKALFSCGSHAASLNMAFASGWTERKGGWICPHCASGAVRSHALPTVYTQSPGQSRFEDAGPTMLSRRSLKPQDLGQAKDVIATVRAMLRPPTKTRRRA
jgi:hypothetical protein